MSSFKLLVICVVFLVLTIVSNIATTYFISKELKEFDSRISILETIIINTEGVKNDN